MNPDQKFLVENLQRMIKYIQQETDKKVAIIKKEAGKDADLEKALLINPEKEKIGKRMEKELEDYKKWLKEKTQEFVKALADEGMQISRAKFQSATYDGTNDVSVSVESMGENKAAVVAIGSSVLFIEFGTGVKYPDSHPEAGKFGFEHGGYGHHLGRLEKGWRYHYYPGGRKWFFI